MTIWKKNRIKKYINFIYNQNKQYIWIGDDRMENTQFENDPHISVKPSDLEFFHLIK
jgi:hypothetical protein